MKKTTILLIMMLLSSMTFAQVSTWDGTWEPWTHGTGTEADPFLIENARQLAYLAYRVNNGLDAGGGHVSNHDLHYKLMVDVNLNGSENFQWTPIGYWNSDSDYQCFGGHFDGNGHVVSGMYINSSANRVGLFGNVDGVTICNTSVSGETIETTGQYAGGIIGVARSMITVYNCNTNLSNFVSSTLYAGGIVGCCINPTVFFINNSNNTSNVNSMYAGGITGAMIIIGSIYSTNTMITNCCNLGSMTTNGYYSYSGGIVGWLSGVNANINNCYNRGNLTSNGNNQRASGGIVGYSQVQEHIAIKSCYNTGDVLSNNGNCGGILGSFYYNAPIINNCYYLATCGGNNTYGGQPMSADAMKTQEFAETLNNGLCSWEYDYSNTNSGYPILTGVLVIVTTQDATNITQSHATLGSVIETENTTVQSKGFEYKKTNDTNYSVINVIGNGNIITTLSGLTPNTAYTFRAFCTPINCGTYYGQEKSFNTQSIYVTTNNATDVSHSHATLNGNLNVGDANISSQGFQYKKTTDSEYQSVVVSGSGDISTTLSNLTPNTQYRFRAFCTPQGCEPIYGQERTFNTLAINVTTNNATDVTQTHATLNGNLNTGDANIVSQGFQYKKTSDSEYQTVEVLGNGNISVTLSDLSPNTQYRFRAFCNPQGSTPVFGQEMTFNTLTINVTTYPASNITESSATLNGQISAGDADVVDKGFKYWPVNDPQNINAISVPSTGSVSAIINNLAQNTYQYRAFALSDGIMYQGATQQFEISPLNIDTIFVSNAETLRWVAEQCNNGTTFEGKYIKMIDDIELPFNVPNNMTSIGSYPDRPFKGTFDGNGKLITNLYIDQPNTPYQGFFGYTLNANLYNVGLVNITASGRNYTGGMVAYAKNTYMRDCYVNGGTLFALSYCGGLVGYQEQGTNSIISGCYNTCEVTGNNYVGGLIGFSNYSTVRNSYVAGRVSAQGEPVGAIIGGAKEVLMYYCYFSTELTGQTEAIGENNFKGGEGLTNAQMRDPQFVNTLNQNLVEPVWMADYASHINNGFPIIKWQRPGTGVEENVSVKKFISLFPNPAKGFVTIQSDEPSVTLKHVEVYDVMGRMVLSETLDGQSQEFSISKLVSGFYHVRVQTNNGHCSNLKLVVQ